MTRFNLFCSLLLVIAVSCTQHDKQAGIKFLRVQGPEIVDEDGRRVFLRAVGLGNYLLPEGYMWKFGKDGDRPRAIEKLVADLIGAEKAHDFWRQFRNNYITEADIARIKALGFNTVRPAINWRVLMNEETGAFDKEGFALLDNLVEWCKIHQIYIVLDMHGAPGGQTGSNIDDSRNNFPELFRDSTAQERFIALWVKLAERYKNEPIVAAYDLLNEPLPNEFKQFHAELEPLYRRTIEAIRKVDSRHMISLEGAHWSTDFTVFSPPFDDNTFYQFHKYWSTPDIKSLEPFLTFRAQYNVPLWLGESGENNLDWYWAAYQLFEDQNIGWLFWPWKKMDTENTPYSIKAPLNWERIVEFSNGGEKPAPAEAEKILNDLLENVKLENCVYFPDVVNAVFRRVPARIQAENFGHLGEGLSYSLLETTQPAAAYRVNEPVPIIELTAETSGRRRSAEYAVRLQADEWLAFEINSSIDQVMKAIVKVRAESEKPAMHLEVDGKVAELSQNYNKADFYFNSSRPFTLTRGRHNVKLVVDDGTVLIDWFEVK